MRATTDRPLFYSILGTRWLDRLVNFIMWHPKHNSSFVYPLLSLSTTELDLDAGKCALHSRPIPQLPSLLHHEHIYSLLFNMFLDRLVGQQHRPFLGTWCRHDLMSQARLSKSGLFRFRGRKLFEHDVVSCDIYSGVERRLTGPGSKPGIRGVPALRHWPQKEEEPSDGPRLRIEDCYHHHPDSVVYSF